MRDIDKFRGCLIGGAAGDALGYAVEFLQEEQIFSRYGSDGICEYSLTGDIAQISDDTQMILFTANGLLLAATRGKMRGIIGSYESYIKIMYQCWYKTQTQAYPVKDGRPCSWLLNVPELFSERAPGMTCLSAIEKGAEGTIDDPINNSKGCGGVMRVAPIGLYFCGKNISYDKTDMLGAQAAALTHGHDLGFIPAAALTHIIRAVVEREMPLKAAVNEAMAATQKLFAKAEHIADFTALMKKAVKLSETAKDDLAAIHSLGEGWVAEETLAIAVYCSLKYQNDFDKALRASVNHSGDSDSTGAVTGNILGASLGYQAIPQKYKDRLELSDVILEIADDLCSDCPISEYGKNSDEAWERKYIYANYLKK